MINHLMTLYKRGRDSILEWNIKIEQINNKVNLFMSYGLMDGKQVIRYQNNIKGKNKGKVNETTSLEQAQLEAQSKINLKLKEGYISIDSLLVNDEIKKDHYDSSISLKSFLDKYLPAYNTDVNGNEIPMKCQQYYRDGKEFTDPTGKVWDKRKYYLLTNPTAPVTANDLVINFPCFIQPKVNGVRAFIKLVNGKAVIFSKKGLIYNLPHISTWLENNKELFNYEGQDVILDGELYIPGYSLQSISSAVKAWQIESLNVMFYLFDIAIEDVPQDKRFKEALYTPEKKAILAKAGSLVYLVPTHLVGTNNQVQEFTDKYISEGYEGSICRDTKGLYEFGKRPKTIVKLKRTMSTEVEIIDVIPYEKDDTIGMYVCRTKDGNEFKVNPKMSTADKKNLLINRMDFIGKQLTITFYEYTDDGLPFHLIDNIVRDYE